MYQIADAAYPLIVSFENIDNMLHSIRNPTECPFGWLKACCGFLKRTIALQLENTPAAIFSCFVLHNFCEMNQCGVDSAWCEN